MKNIKIYGLLLVGLVVGGFTGYQFSKTTQQGTQEVAEAHNHDEASIYTCSMHPQIRQNEPGECPICGMDLIPLETNTSNDPLVLEMTPAAVQLANIQTSVVGGNIANTGNQLRLSGKIQADERLAASQVAHVAGRIEKLFVTFTGEKINKGQALATLYAPELITAQRELVEALKLQTVNPGLVEAARNKLRFLKISDSVINDIETSGVIKENFTLYADESGIVTKRRVAVGDYVKRGEPLFDIVNLGKVWVVFDVYEKDLAQIAMRDKITFSVASLPRKEFNTRITFIDPVINPNTRVAAVRAEVNNTGGLLKPEMFVTGTLQKTPKTSAHLTIPKSAVLWTGKRSVVYVKRPDRDIPSFEFRAIELGDAQGEAYVVTKGLEAGEEVVTYGSFTIDAAAQLNNQTSMMNQNVKVEGVKKEEKVPDYTTLTPDDFKKQLTKVTEAYLTLKDAFVATDAKEAAQTAGLLVEALAATDMKLLKGDAHLYWMDQLNALMSHTKKITTLEDVEAQRKQFDFLSQALIRAVKAFGTVEKKLYLEHCPMAFDFEGADWLSSEKEIANPYFGDVMMRCGSVLEEL